MSLSRGRGERKKGLAILGTLGRLVILEGERILELERAKKNQRERKKEFLKENLEEGGGLSFGSLIS